jgi:ribosomal protein L37E
MKPIFDKNDVQIEFAYEINHTEREAPELACPRCGHVQPRRKNVVCASCNHMIPTESPRQTWQNLPTAKDSYRKMAEVFFDEGKTREFRKSRGNFGWQIFVRNVFVTMLLATMVMVPTVFGLRAYVGEKDWKKVEAKFDAVIGPAFHRLDTRPKVASSAVPNSAPKAKPSKKSKRGSHK